MRVELNEDRVDFSAPETHTHAKFGIVFHRTLRIPDTQKTYNLPPSLGKFPLRLVDDYRERVPSDWVRHGGILFPMAQAEAMWIQFERCGYPFLVRVATGKVNAVSGEPWTDEIRKGDHMVCPPQPWLDGFCVEPGKIRQFVAMPLGLGCTVEQQVTGKEDVGGVQIEVIPMKGSEYDARCSPPRRAGARRRQTAGGQSTDSSDFEEVKTSGGVLYSTYATKCSSESYSSESINYIDELSEAEPGVLNSVAIGASSSDSPDPSIFARSVAVPKADMGLGAGGMMAQEIFSDTYPLDVWDLSQRQRFFVHLTNSFAWQAITKEAPPKSPCSASLYQRFGYTWYDHYLDAMPIESGGANLKGLKTVMELGYQQGLVVLPNNEDLPGYTRVRRLADVRPNQVREGAW